MRAEAAALERARADRAAAIESRRAAKRAALAAEPAAGEPAALLRIRMPDGSMHQRRFEPGQTLGVVFDFVDQLDGTCFWSYELVSSFPRRAFGLDSTNSTLQELQLAPQAALFVQPGDDDE